MDSMQIRQNTMPGQPMVRRISSLTVKAAAKKDKKEDMSIKEEVEPEGAVSVPVQDLMNSNASNNHRKKEKLRLRKAIE